MPSQDQTANPLLGVWRTPFAVPPFASIEPAHYPPAFARAIEIARANVAAIAGDPAPPSFANTVEALERAEADLERVALCFFNLLGANASPALEEIERDIAPKLAALDAETLTNAALFARVDALMKGRETLGLDDEQKRVLELCHRGFVRAGARLSKKKRARVGAIAERLATLYARFAQNLLADEREWALPLMTAADMAGLPAFLRDAAASAARERGLKAKGAITLSRSLIEPFLTFSERRDLRERAQRAWASRGRNGGATDNRALIREILALRDERARLLGHASFAAYQLEPQMAETPENAKALLERVWRAAKARAGREAEALQALIQQEGGNFELAAWDWRHYAEKERKRAYALDEARIKSYFQLEQVRDAAFDCAGRLFGLSFHPLPDLPVYHPDVEAWEARRGKRHVGVFLTDYFARPSKRSGAWMTQFRAQSNFEGAVRPIVVNVANFAKASRGPTLLTFDDARTLFHEFGHALHGLLSNVAYPRISGTRVARDFVELPSQLFEHWLETPEILSAYARHYRSGKPMPKATMRKMLAARNFNQGFATVEYVASALVDLALHSGGEVEDPLAVEAETLASIGMPEAIVMRHASPHFAHVFAGEGYAAGYYSYMWSEVMDADAFAVFGEAGDPFDAKTAKRLERHIYSAGGRQEPAEAYRAFRGRLPGAEALIAERGLEEPADAPG